MGVALILSVTLSLFRIVPINIVYLTLSMRYDAGNLLEGGEYENCVR